jgi:predicted enzyme related to lactoylglutathione lyase
MPECEKHPAGTFCWAELCTTDSEAAKKFYCDMFGWDYHDDPVGPDAVYTMLQQQSKNVGALYQRNPQQAEQGVPPHWGSYVSVSAVDAAAGQARELGGHVIMEPFDVFDIGRMAVLADPTGAVFSLWQPRQHIGAQVKQEPGTLCWNELMTHDTDRAEAFYTALFDWKAQTDDVAGNPYTMFMLKDTPAGGMMSIQPEWGEVPPHWLVYFAVADCEERAEWASAHGAKLIVPPTAIPEVGRFAIVEDPQGAVFGIVELAQPA